ncbi:hypothetical protein BJ875DRAFT_486991 [Amylocarpus encephaloides]|uniref:Centrosomin N-terminal motif 1 domain-containing protein n=1 Tax=Amylocarpus encephaloides TaxID=45428 RepID=A0A9P8C3Y4_9HELO|nr:hypothetical protein BJ875DRAFT_486991 [Amylocarpus encephaloides]
MTPTSSSNGSSAHLPSRMNPGSTGRATPLSGASLLQDRLRERKGEAARHRAHGSMDMSHLRDREVQSSPIARDDKKPSSGGGKRMGVKQVEEQVSTLHKQNFDLKLELYHRRQRQDDLEARLEAAERRLEEQAELQELNEQLLSELEKRDQAVEEAVGVIVDLEDKVDRLMKEREGVRAFEANYESRSFGPGHDDFPSSPPSVQHTPGNNSINSVPRMPSFLSEKSEGTDALRSLYLPTDRSVVSDAASALPALTEEASTTTGMDSPRLSVLSESSLVSIYGQKTMMDETPEPESPSPPRRKRVSESVEKWIDERPAHPPVVAAPIPARQLKRNGGAAKSQYLSINTILDSPLQRLEKLRHTLEKHSSNTVSTPTQSSTSSSKSGHISKDVKRPVLKDQDSFEQRALPPTPDTFSTDTLRRFQSSNSDMFAQNPRPQNNTFLDSTSTFQTRQRSHVSIRPRSAGETITSKRDGHGWDTETQGDYTETGSDISNLYHGPSIRRPQRVVTPDLFSFGGNEPGGWAQEIMYSTAAHLPTSGNSAADRYRASRRLSMIDPQRTEDSTPTIRQTRFIDGSAAMDVSQFNPPDRQNSLAAPTKLKKAPTELVVTPVAVSPAKNSKISRLSGRIFGSGKTEMGLPATTKPSAPARGSSYISEGLDDARATPPPIRRNRTGPMVERRPVSAGMGSSRRMSEFGYDGALDEVNNIARTGVELPTPETDNNIAKSAVIGGKKWFGIGRNGSLSRRN